MDIEKITQKIKENMTVEFEPLWEDTSVRGNVLCSDDPEQDKRVEDEIINRIMLGDIWAWFTAKVKVTYRGFEQTDYLGCCSYQSEEECKESGLIEEMTEECVWALARMVKEILDDFEE